jgi:hypothetical protein
MESQAFQRIIPRRLMRPHVPSLGHRSLLPPKTPPIAKLRSGIRFIRELPPTDSLRLGNVNLPHP